MNIEIFGMKRSVYVIFFALATMMFWTTGCTEKKTETQDSIVDSVLVDSAETDTLESLIGEQVMPKAADELFDDFIFNFAANKKLQNSRIDFPLPVEDFGTQTVCEARKWKMEHFFMRQGFYTLVVGTMKDLDVTKDTKVDHVVIEKIYLSKNYVQQFEFNRVDGLWKMQKVRKESIPQNANGDFYAFYQKFVNDSTFCQESLADEVQFSGPDPDDDFARMDGSIMPEQWSMFAPELPKDMIYNIRYGSKPISGNQRILVVRGIANGFETELTFRKSKGKYLLVKLNT